MSDTVKIKDQSSAISAIKLRKPENADAVLGAAEAWAKKNNNKFVQMSVSLARKQDAAKKG